jgi:hypothetical protein
MRVFTALVFSFLLLISLFGFYVSFVIQRCNIRAEVAHQVKRDKSKAIVRLVFTCSEYRHLPKYDGGKEFSWQGNMYDVIERKTDGDRIVLTVYLDHKETSLVDKFLSVFEEETDGEEDDNTSGSAINLPEFIALENQLIFRFSESSFRLPKQASRTLSSFADILSPPPDTAV